MEDGNNFLTCSSCFCQEVSTRRTIYCEDRKCSLPGVPFEDHVTMEAVAQGRACWLTTLTQEAHCRSGVPPPMPWSPCSPAVAQQSLRSRRRLYETIFPTIFYGYRRIFESRQLFQTRVVPVQAMKPRSLRCQAGVLSYRGTENEPHSFDKAFGSKFCAGPGTGAYRQ